MARKTQIFTVEQPGRDQGKKFLITEMPAAQAERWALRIFMLAISHGTDISDEIVSGGMAALAQGAMTMIARIPFDEAEPLLDEMLGCVQAIPDPARPEIVRKLVESDIEEVATLLQLRKAVIDLHVDF